MSTKQLLILEILLNANTELYGLEIIERSQRQLRKGTIYIYLADLETMNLISSRLENAEQPESPYFKPRRPYKITENGRRAFDYSQLTNIEGLNFVI